MQANDLFFKQEFLEFQKEISSFIEINKRVFLSSSFQTQSLPLLHMVSMLKEKNAS
jgi:hypothetical protein